MRTRTEILKDIYSRFDEAIRVTKPDGIIMFAFLSIYALMHTNYLFGNWHTRKREKCLDHQVISYTYAGRTALNECF